MHCPYWHSCCYGILCRHTISIRFLFPPPLKVGDKIVEMTSDGELLFHTWASLYRIFVGYFWGCLLGITIGAGIGLSKLLSDFVDPPIQFVRSITPVAIVPLAILAFGLGEASKYVVIIYGSFVPVVLNTAAGLASVPKIRIRAAQSLGAPSAQYREICDVAVGMALHIDRPAPGDGVFIYGCCGG